MDGAAETEIIPLVGLVREAETNVIGGGQGAACD